MRDGHIRRSCFARQIIWIVLVIRGEHGRRQRGSGGTRRDVPQRGAGGRLHRRRARLGRRQHHADVPIHRVPLVRPRPPGTPCSWPRFCATPHSAAKSIPGMRPLNTVRISRWVKGAAGSRPSASPSRTRSRHLDQKVMGTQRGPRTCPPVQVTASGSESRNVGIRSRNVSSATLISMRARLEPRHRWMPEPNAK